MTDFTSISKNAIPVMIAAIISLLLSSCFTGVEGTKKITLSKEDRKALDPSPEELFFNGIKGSPLAEWEIGKLFIAADNKTILIFDQQGLPPDPDLTNIGGKILSFIGTGSRMGPDGKMTVTIAFRDGDNVYSYNTGKTAADADSILSDQIPMLIDSHMIDETRKLLSGKTFWIKSALWYDAEGNRVAGMKYIPVEIVDAMPASAAFPIKIRFRSEDGAEAWAFMNFGNSGNESRAFPALFSLSDIRKKYPSVLDDIWQAICMGKVKTGMTKTECKLALGNPSEVNSGRDYSQTLDLWHYTDGTVLWFEDGILTKFRR